MARRRRKHHDKEQGPAQSEKPVPDATTSLGSLLKAAHVVVPKPPVKPRAAESKARVLPTPNLPPVMPNTSKPGEHAATELRMLNDAYDGARPLLRKNARQVVQRVLPRGRSEEERAEELAARKRLAELVSGGVHFKVQREDEYVRGYRSEGSRKLVDRLGGQGYQPEATLDLHGERAARVTDLVAGFVRGHHRKGARNLLIIVGKGLHSEAGTSVLLPALIEALTHGLAAPLVRGFATAHQRLGGTGAVAILLI
jgi:DNA-nicking Smr family endonuclease